MDPFEARLTFTELLANLNSSSQTIDRIAHFASTNNELAENLLDCLLEKTDTMLISARLNIIFVINAICDKEKKVKHNEWMKVLDPVLPQLIQMVIPKNAEGDANLGFTKKVIDSWKKRGYFGNETIHTLCLLFSDRSYIIPHTENKKSDTLRKIEEDRENHKRLKESLWIRKVGESEVQEYLDMRESVTEFSLGDWVTLRQELIKSRRDKITGNKELGSI